MHCAGYVKLESGTFVGGPDIEIILTYRTQLSHGLLLFAFGGTGTYFMLQLQDGSLLWEMSINGEEYWFKQPMSNTSSMCDGQWHAVTLARQGTQMKVTVDTLPYVSVGDPTQPVDGIAISSYLYLGGIPDDDSEAVEFIRRNHLDQQIQHSQSLLFIFQLLFV